MRNRKDKIIKLKDMNELKFDIGFTTNLVLVTSEAQMVVVIVMNQHLVEGSRIYTAVEDSPAGINVYTEKLEDLAERYDIPKELILKEISKLLPKADNNNREVK